MRKLGLFIVVFCSFGLGLGVSFGSQDDLSDSQEFLEMIDGIDVMGRGDLSCSTRDAGHEEHWGGHGSCRSCLKKHGSCYEVCYERFYVCAASGLDYNGNKRSGFRGRGQNQWRAEERALRRCERAGYENCDIEDCRRVNELASRRGC